jgi:hypothetical protein
MENPYQKEKVPPLNSDEGINHMPLVPTAQELILDATLGRISTSLQSIVFYSINNGKIKLNLHFANWT